MQFRICINFDFCTSCKNCTFNHNKCSCIEKVIIDEYNRKIEKYIISFYVREMILLWAVINKKTNFPWQTKACFHGYNYNDNSVNSVAIQEKFSNRKSCGNFNGNIPFPVGLVVLITCWNTCQANIQSTSSIGLIQVSLRIANIFFFEARKCFELTLMISRNYSLRSNPRSLRF